MMEATRIVGVIPARFGSTRFPGKPLAMIAGQPMLKWVIDGARQSRRISQLIVATDDRRIADLAASNGVEVAMTDSDLPTGTDRVWHAVKNIDADIVVNIQGDEPLIRGDALDRLVEPLTEDPTLQMTTLGRPLTAESLFSTLTAKIVVNRRDEALYFSRSPIPYSRIERGSPDPALVAGDLTAGLKHLGIYAYRKGFLEVFCAQEPIEMEMAESLEQLRALWLGARIKVVRVSLDCWGVDRPEDVQKIEKIMRGER